MAKSKHWWQKVRPIDLWWRGGGAFVCSLHSSEVSGVSRWIWGLTALVFSLGTLHVIAGLGVAVVRGKRPFRVD